MGELALTWPLPAGISTAARALRRRTNALARTRIVRVSRGLSRPAGFPDGSLVGRHPGIRNDAARNVNS